MKKLDTIDAYFEGTDIHDEQHVGAGCVLALIAAIILTVLHGYNAWLFFFDGSLSFTKAFIFHAILSFAAALLAFVFSGVARENRFFILLFISTITMGIFGAAGTLLAIILHIWFMRFANPFAEWFTSIFPSSHISDTEQVYEDIQVGRDESSKPYSVISFMDVIQHGTEAQKRTALSKMTSRFHPSFAPAFKKALNDSSNNIRIQAATAISKIEDQFMTRLIKLNELHEQNPQNAVITMALAEHYDNYAFTGILDDDRERQNRAQALKYYKEYLDLEPGSSDAYVKIGRLLMRSNEPDEALNWLRQGSERGHQSPAIITWLAEALYACGYFSELRQLAEGSSWKAHAESLHPSVLECLHFWSGTTPQTNQTSEANI